ncbi:unnamed protein product [Paramecium primaurelia]|uniref:CSC1/OSCA1-like cytosolic domain-containing protein n=1 Tax=Paramecium primaurelia TaxID=5886 RepID=A0A8S1MIG8_PARPR|nr:unnamed protein product [Paramecium primaurelia]
MNNSDNENLIENFEDDQQVYTNQPATLDFNLERQGQVPQQHRFSSTKFRERLSSIDPLEWAKNIKMPENNYYTYPCNYDLAELHRQCHYIQPDQDFLDKTQATECPCCNKQLNRKRINFLTVNMWQLLVEDYGIAAPLYFTFLKFQMILFIIIFCVYGIFFITEVNWVCSDTKNNICLTDPHLIQEYEDACELNTIYMFVAIDPFLSQIKCSSEIDIQNGGSGFKWVYVQIAAFIIFLMNILLPLEYEIIIRYKQIKYWDKEPTNHVTENKKSVYVRHLPYKMTAEEISQTICKAIAMNNFDQVAKKSVLFEHKNSIQELVYIYDIHEINEMNIDRENSLLDFMITLEQMRELKETGMITTYSDKQIKTYKSFNLEILDNLFKQQLKDIMFKTQKIKSYLKNGLPYTNKVIIKFETKEQRDAAYLHYRKKWYQNLLIRYEVMKEQNRLKKLQNNQVADITSLYSDSRTVSVDDLQIQSQPVQQARVSVFNQNTQLAKQQYDYSNKYVEQVHYQIGVKRGFRINGIFWENLGMDTFKRLKFRLKAIFTAAIASCLLMGSFELIYFYQNNPNQVQRKSDGQLSTWEKILANCLAILVTFLSSYTTLTILGQMAKSRRSTFIEVEESIMHFFVIIQYFLIQFFPYIATFEIWGGQKKIVACYDLVTLSIHRIIFKQIFHTFHIRHTRFWLRKRKALKNFNPKRFFQGQLNQIMTPAFISQRGRQFNMLFILTTALCLIYICPVAVLFCLGFTIYIYFWDKYAITHNYQIDKRFTIELFSHQIKCYQIVVLPFSIYLFLRLFWRFDWIVYSVFSVGILMIIVIIFKKRIVKFIIFKIFRLRKKIPQTEFREQSFFRSYNKFFENLRIESLTDILVNLFRSSENESINKQSID